jgi:chromosome segregation ATPase
MEFTLTTELSILLLQILAGIISLVIVWQKLGNRIEKLELQIAENNDNDKALRLKVEALDKLYTKIEVLETKQNAQNEAIHYSITMLNSSIEKLNNKLDTFVNVVNNTKLDVEALKK